MSGLYDFLDYGNIHFSFGVNGMGESGVSSVQLEFDVYDEYNFLTDSLSEQTEVTVSCPELFFTSQTFFLTKCSTSQKILHCSCYDRMCKTDKLFDVSGFTSETASGQSVLSAICHQCGFKDYGASASGLEYIKFKKSNLENVTCRRLLEDIAEAAVGVFVCGYDNSLYLACLGGGEYGNTAWAEDYTEIDYQGSTRITALTMTNSDTGEEYSFSGGEAASGTALAIDSPLATQQLALTVWERVGNYIYKSWHCDMADITFSGFLDRMSALIFIRNDVPDDSGLILGKQLFATTTEFSCDSTGVYFSGGAAPYDNWNYQSYLNRSKLSIGKNVGNTAISTNGDIIFRNLNKGGGLNEHDNGISICVRNRNQ